MKALILAAGEGTRLRPYTLDRPKCLVEVDGISLLERQLAVLRSEGVDSVTLIGGYRAEMLKRPDATLRLNPRFHETNMVWTLFSAEDELQGDLVLAYGDIVYSRDVLRALLASTADIAVAIDGTGGSATRIPSMMPRRCAWIVTAISWKSGRSRPPLNRLRANTWA